MAVANRVSARPTSCIRSPANRAPCESPQFSFMVELSPQHSLQNLLIPIRFRHLDATFDLCVCKSERLSLAHLSQDLIKPTALILAFPHLSRFNNTGLALQKSREIVSSYH